MKTKICRRCACGCGQITRPGNRYVFNHHTHKNKRFRHTKIKRRCSCGCGEVTNLGRKYINGHNRAMKGRHHTKESKLKISLSRIRYNPNNKYCEVWRDREYKKDLRKDYCENVDCKNNYKYLSNHHINLNKKDCHPSNIITMCNSCHITLHNQFRQVNKHSILTINRSDHITYIHKRTRRIIVTIIKKSNSKNNV